LAGNVFLSPEEAVFVHLETIALSPPPQGRIVVPAAREMMEGIGVLRGRNDAEIGVDSLPQGDADLGVPPGDDGGRLGQGSEVGRQPWRIIGGGQQVDVFYGFVSPPQRSGDVSGRDLRPAEEGRLKTERRADRLYVQTPLPVVFQGGDPHQNIFLGFPAEARQVQETVFLGGVFQFSDGGDAQLLVEEPDPFRTEAGDSEHLEMAGGDGCL